ncbi:hypothetical protein MMC14_009344 [Varicellaria rhodocarpa]|nr:hypothetical protein [Varicellaria rhodocarpa]
MSSLHFLKTTQTQFQIPTLGILTFLGVEKIDRVVGRLTRAPYTSCPPLFGAFKIAGKDLVQHVPGVILYNVTDGPMATDVPGWFARWLICQELKYTSSMLHVSARQEKRSIWFDGLRSYTLGFLAMVPLLVLAILTGDGWSFANVVSMVISVLVRHIVVAQNLSAIDLAVAKSMRTSLEQVKILMTLPSGQLITIKTSRGLVLNCLLTTPRPPNPAIYSVARALGWLAFGA